MHMDTHILCAGVQFRSPAVLCPSGRKEICMTNIILESVKGPRLIPLDDIFLKERKIFFYGQVTEESCDDLIKKLLILEATDNTSPITLFINSPGGEVGSGLAVYDTIRVMKSPVRACVTGMAASMGAIILVACDKERRFMLDHSKIMIHDCSWESRNMGGRKPHEIETELSQLKSVNERLISILAEGCNKSVEEIAEVTRQDSYFDAEEAIEFGLASKVIDTDTLTQLLKEGE